MKSLLVAVQCRNFFFTARKLAICYEMLMELLSYCLNTVIKLSGWLHFGFLSMVIKSHATSLIFWLIDCVWCEDRILRSRSKTITQPNSFCTFLAWANERMEESYFALIQTKQNQLNHIQWWMSRWCPVISLFHWMNNFYQHLNHISFLFFFFSNARTHIYNDNNWNEIICTIFWNRQTVEILFCFVFFFGLRLFY